MKESQTKTTKVQRIVAIVLTCLFIPMIFAFGIYGVLSEPEKILKSVRYSYAHKFLADPDDTSFFPMTSARIASLQNQLGEHIPFKEELGYINASFQYGLGKDLVMQGSQQLLSLPEGQIYNMTTRESLAAEAMEVVGLYEQIGGRIPFLFSYINPQFYEGGTPLPPGYDVIDTGDELADEVLSIVRDAGIEALDSRTFFKDTPYTSNDLNLKTDMHWTTLAGLLAAQIYAEEIERMTGVDLDTSKIQLDQFATETYENIFLGEYGQQVGEMNSGLDDITFFWPEYETSFSRRSVKRDRTEQFAQGSFKDAVIKWEALETEPGETNISAYRAYGLIEHIEEITNHGECEDTTILMFRDSYSAPVGCFLSLMAKNVVMVDMRSADLTAIEYVEKYDPDIVVCSLSRQMYEDHAYDMGTGYAEYAEALYQ